MNKKCKNKKFEFVLRINKHVICQREFNVRDYNEEIIHSLELKQLMDKLVGMNSYRLGMIPKFLKEESMKYLWDNYNPYYIQTNVNVGKNNFKKEEIFEFEIKVDDNSVAKSIFSGNWFEHSIRYNVNIKSIIPDIISEIAYYFRF
jgi:hypothetical protein